jgi:hypothetical protein
MGQLVIRRRRSRSSAATAMSDRPTYLARNRPQGRTVAPTRMATRRDLAPPCSLYYALSNISEKIIDFLTKVFYFWSYIVSATYFSRPM